VTAVSARGYARHRRAAGLSGGTHRAVLKAMRAGRISAGADGRIDPQQADAQWATHTTPRAVAFTPRAAGSPPSGPGPLTALAEVTVRERRARAMATELAVARLVKNLVPAKEVELRWAACIVTARTALLGLPSRARQRLPHLTPMDVSVLDALVREVLAELAAPRGGPAHPNASSSDGQEETTRRPR
jgi:hypothetical protein